mgnify:CR=1 FL=1
MIHHHLLKEVNLGVRDTVRVRPPPIQVDTHDRASTVANCDSIRVYHWNQLNHIFGQYLLILVRLLGQLPYDLAHDPRPWSLSCMHPRLQVDILLLVEWNALGTSIHRESQHVDIQSTD